MSAREKEKIKVTLNILDNNYPLKCEAHDRNLLIEAAEILNAYLQEVRSDNPKLSHERLMALGGLQMAFELLRERQTLAREVSMVNQATSRILSALIETVEQEKN